MRTAIITDSNSGIFEEEGRERGIYIAPMPVIIEGRTYCEGIDLSHEEFYQMMTEGKEISSSQPSLYEVTEVWDKAFMDGSEY